MPCLSLPPIGGGRYPLLPKKCVMDGVGVLDRASLVINNSVAWGWRARGLPLAGRRAWRRKEAGRRTMAENKDSRLPDPVELSHSMAEIAERSQRLVAEFLQRQHPIDGAAVPGPGIGMGMGDPLNIGT